MALTSEQKSHVVNRVGKALDYQFEVYGWYDMIDDLEFTKEEAQWAKDNLSYQVVNYENK